MPCDSRVTETAMRDHLQLKAALEAEDYEVTEATETNVRARHRAGLGRLDFYKRFRGEKEPFSTDSTDEDRINAVQRKYGEIGLRTYAQRKGYTVQKDGQAQRKYILTKRGR